MVHLAGTETITGAKSFSEAITSTGGFKDADVSTAIKLGDSGNTVPTTGNKTIVGAINELNTKNKWRWRSAFANISDSSSVINRWNI